MRTISEWNNYLDNVKRLRDAIYYGMKSPEGIQIHLEKDECEIIWNLLNSEANVVFSTPLVFHRK